MLLAALALAACGTPPLAPPPVQALPPQQADRQVTLSDRGGVVRADVKARDLARLQAEGRPAALENQLGILAARGEADLYRGNTARLLVDGPATFAAMKDAIAAARHRVLLQSYIVEDEGVAAEIGGLLLQRAAEGVKIAFIYDSVGSLGTASAFFDRLRAGGVAVCEFNPVNPLQRPGHWGWIERSHRKLLVADSDVAYTGGINLSDVYANGSSGSGPIRRRAQARDKEDGEPDTGWRDTQIELRGPVVGGLATVFAESWGAQGCEGALPPAPPPRQATAGERIVKLLAARPEKGVNPTYTAWVDAVRAAQRSVRLTVGYFAPGDDMLEALADAARRGVQVSLMLPGRSDVTMVLHAARSHYARLLEAGVEIHEMRHAVMHAKTAVVDGVFASVGSSNLDTRSITLNDEIDVIVLGDDFGNQMDALFAHDIATSTRIDPAAWPQRGLAQRLMEGVGRLLQPLL